MDFWITVVADDYLALKAHAGVNEPSLAVAVCGLVKIQKSMSILPHGRSAELGVQVE